MEKKRSWMIKFQWWLLNGREYVSISLSSMDDDDDFGTGPIDWSNKLLESIQIEFSSTIYIGISTEII